jgi:rRNA pseudouridine-1189 N-methylase Emg1 (Nep1/Mra1 family)
MINCPYCKKNVIKFSNKRVNYCLIDKCANHYPIDVYFWENEIHLRPNIVYSLKISKKDIYLTFYSIFIYIEENKMILKKYGNHILNMEYDKNLTPENFFQKVKTYLSFL